MKKIWYCLKPIILCYTVQYLLIILGILLYSLISGNDLMFITETEIYSYTLLGTCITSLPISIWLYRKFKVSSTKIKGVKLFLMIPLGMSISLFYNMLTMKFQGEVNIDINVNMVLLVFYSVVFVPIFEEFVFRYVALKNARDKYSLDVAVVLISLSFALMHSGFWNMIYAFLIGVILSYIYLKYKNIMYPIILHISANLMSVCISEFNIVALIVSFICLIMFWVYFKKYEHILK